MRDDALDAKGWKTKCRVLVRLICWVTTALLVPLVIIGLGCIADRQSFLTFILTRFAEGGWSVVWRRTYLRPTQCIPIETRSKT